ncbi:Putative RING-H2 finger protein ATL71 [Apostasia shenzhenica]|uniref:RING-type E3 ubiquitin transferase n=1 Tax=Apostasia shenzhenica TaxID=1088818 RepID=A0A2H9ZR79_9ASPA|nr:Putative RING-H2 finger protein ATL71 [Apostasia shenzhenica]
MSSSAASGGTGPTGNQYSGVFASNKIGGLGYGVTISIGVLLITISISLAAFFCTRHRGNNSQPSQSRRTASSETDAEEGLSDEALSGYPTVVYSQVTTSEKAAAATAAVCCSICLADYNDSDELRRLPECGHLFHVLCVDPWLRQHPTCPVCRTSPLQSPAATPLAEVTPLARAALVNH